MSSVPGDACWKRAWRCYFDARLALTKEPDEQASPEWDSHLSTAPGSATNWTGCERTQITQMTVVHVKWQIISLTLTTWLLVARVVLKDFVSHRRDLLSKWTHTALGLAEHCNAEQVAEWHKAEIPDGDLFCTDGHQRNVVSYIF